MQFQFIRATRHCIAVSFLCLTMLNGTLWAQLDVQAEEHWWTPDGRVNAMVVDSSNNVVYLGGEFTAVGPNVAMGVAVDAGTGLPDLGFLSPNGDVNAAVPDGNGGWFIGGRFDQIGGTPRAALARINADGSLHAWNPGCDGEVNALDLVAGVLFVAGDFTQAGDQPRKELAALDPDTGEILGLLGDPSSPTPQQGSIRAIAATQDTLFIGGTFQTLGLDRPYSAILGMDVLNPFPLSARPNGTVHAVISDGAGGWFLGGEFTAVDGQPRGRLAHINATGELLPWNPDCSGTVRSLDLEGGVLYAGGEFASVGGQVRRGIAAIDPEDGSVSSLGDPSAHALDISAVSPNTTMGSVNSLDAVGDTLFIGGSFASLGAIGQNCIVFDAADGLPELEWPITVNAYRAVSDGLGGWFVSGFFDEVAGQPRQRLARLNTDGSLHPWNPGCNGQIEAMMVDDGVLYIGGDFTEVGGLPRRNLAALDIQSAEVQPLGAPSLHSPEASVRDILRSDNVLYLGGSFTELGQAFTFGVPLQLSTGMPATGTQMPDGRVLAAAQDGEGGWYIGGEFTAVGGQYRPYIARINADGSLHPWYLESNGVVRTLTASGPTLLIGGDFTYLGSNRSHFAALDIGTGQLLAMAPNANGPVRSIVANGSTIYLGGSFTTFGGLPRNRLAAVEVATGLVTPWNPSAGNTVSALALNGNIVLAGGDFATMGGQSRGRIASVDAETGQVNPWAPTADGRVNTILVNGNTVHVGGEFSNIGGSPRAKLATLDAVTGVATTLVTNANALGSVSTLAMVGQTLYVGGSFTSLANSPCTNLALVDVQTATATTWMPGMGPSGSVSILAVAGEQVYVGGDFRSVNGSLRRGLAALDLSSGLSLPWSSSLNGTVNTMSIHEGFLYAGGDFTTVNSTTRNRLAAFDRSTGALLPFDPNLNNPVNAMVVENGVLFAGGSFTTAGGQTRRRIASWNLGSGTLTAMDPNANSTVSAIVVSNGRILLGGSFNSLWGETRNFLAALDAGTGDLLPAWDVITPSSSVVCLAAQGDRILARAGGTLSATTSNLGTFNGDARSNLAAVRISTGRLIDWNPGANNQVYTILANGSTVFAGGAFTMAGNEARNRVASFNLQTGALSLWNPGANGVVNTMVTDGDRVFLGGAFTSLGGTERLRIGAVDVDTGGLLPWAPNADGTVSALAMDDTWIYAGGDFTTIGGSPNQRLAALDIGTGIPSAWTPRPSQAVLALATHNGQLHAGGAFTAIGSVSRSRLAAFEAGSGNLLQWDPGASSTVNALELAGNSVYVGGAFTMLGGIPSSRLGAVDRITGQASPTVPAANGSVNALYRQGQTLYVGGGFSTIGGQFRAKLAALDLATQGISNWNPPGVSSDAGSSSVIYALSVLGDSVFVGGEFTQSNGQARIGLAAFSASSGALFEWAPNASPRVYALAPTQGAVYIGGDFITVGAVRRKYLAAFDMTTGQATPWTVEPNGHVTSLLDAGNKIFAGGNFTAVNGEARLRLVALDKSTGMPTTPVTNIINGLVYDMLLADSIAYVAGSFTSSNNNLTNFLGVKRRNAGAFNINTGEPTEWDPDIYESFASVINNVRALDRSGSTIYLGGSFDRAKGLNRLSIVAVEMTRGDPTHFRPIISTNVAAVHALPGKLVLGGAIFRVDGQPRQDLAAFDLESHELIENFEQGVGGMNAFASRGATLFGGGSGLNFSGSARPYAAAMDTTNGEPLGWSLQNGTSGALDSGSGALSSGVTKLQIAGSRLFLSGTFKISAGQTVRHHFAVVPRCTEQIWYTDADGDGYGDQSSTASTCEQPVGYVASDQDCDDGDMNVFVGANCISDLGFPGQIDTNCVCVGTPTMELPLATALMGPMDENTGLMHDHLRSAGLLPLTEPYTQLGFLVTENAGATVAPMTFNTTGPSAIVDWVLVEIRSATEPTNVLASVAGLLLRNGSVVATDGASTLSVQLPPNDHYVALRHRNHLGIMSATPLPLGPSTAPIDLGDPQVPVYGAAARTVIGGRACLWAGDVLRDNMVKYVGADNDRDTILFAIGGVVPTNVVSDVYAKEDVNLDGAIKYAGVRNDRDMVLLSIGGSTPTAVRLGQLP